MRGVGLTAAEAIGVVALIDQGQIVGRVIKYAIGPQINLPVKARVGALLFPFAATVLLLDGPVAATVLSILYGMSNGILTINRGILPLAMRHRRRRADTRLARGAGTSGPRPRQSRRRLSPRCRQWMCCCCAE